MSGMSSRRPWRRFLEVPEVMVTQRANQMVDELTMEAHHMNVSSVSKDVKTIDEQKPVARKPEG